jgi:hypothetical protein
MKSRDRRIENKGYSGGLGCMGGGIGGLGNIRDKELSVYCKSNQNKLVLPLISESSCVSAVKRCVTNHKKVAPSEEKRSCSIA